MHGVPLARLPVSVNPKLSSNAVGLDRVQYATYETSQPTHGKPEHNHRVEHPDINAQFQGVGCHNPEQIAREGFPFYPSAILRN